MNKAISRSRKASKPKAKIRRRSNRPSKGILKASPGISMPADVWDLDSIFEGGSKSESFAKFISDLEDRIGKVCINAKEIAGSTLKTSDKDVFLHLQDVEMKLRHAASFAYCLSAQNVNDEYAGILLEKVSTLDADLELAKTYLDQAALATADDHWQDFISQPDLSGMAFYWKERRRIASLKMEPELERLATQLAVSGYHSWGRLYSKIAGNLKVPWTERGKKRLLSIGQVANKMASVDRNTRRLAFEKLERAWQSVQDLVAVELNSLAGFRLALYKRRNWESPVFEGLLLGRVRQETVESMWKAVADAREIIGEYVKAKKRLLKISDFRWYDQLAPVGKISRRYSYREACEFVRNNLGSVSEEIGKLVEVAIRHRWIEAQDRPGKAQGAFCTSFPLIKQSRIFMTFSGNYSEVSTLAHELGHAYHSWVLSDLDYYARKYPMTLAETASTLNELILTDAAIATSKSRQERISLLDQKIGEHLQMFCNIRARYIFEVSFYEERKRGALSVERLNDLMLSAQKEAYGDMLAEDGYHPLFWASKLHFSETSVPFYNFPYTFGHLMASAIYRIAKSNPKDFPSIYRGLLADSGSMSCEDLALKHLGVDITKRQFWDDAVKAAAQEVEEFITLTS